MKTSERYPVTQGDVIVNYASSLFDRTEVTAPSLPADVFCGDILDSKTFALFDSAAADAGKPIINLSDMSATDAASKKAALEALTASGDIRLAINADYFKA